MEYLKHALEGSKPYTAVIMTAVMYVMFPEQAYLTAFCAVLGTMVLDILTKYYAIANKNGGVINSIREKHINSNQLWNGTKNKIFAYLIVFILAGLSYRVAPVAGVSVFLATTIYSILFLRECQSILENLVDAGSDLGWLLVFVKKKEQEILKNTEEIEKNDNNSDLEC